MQTRRLMAAILLPAALCALLCGCFTVDVKINQGEESAAAQSYTAPATTAPVEAAQPTQEAESAVPAQPTPTGDPSAMSTADQLLYFNAAVNRIKEGKIGFKKSKLTSTEDITLSNSLANSVVSLVKGALLSENAAETTVNKGENSDAVMSPYNVPYVSRLTEEDIKSIEVIPQNGGYVITVYIKGETNPAASGSISSRIFEFLTVDDVVNTYAPKVNAEVARDDIEVVYDGCYAKATVDSSGALLEYETYVKGTMILHNAKIRIITTDVIAVLASTTQYTDFRY